MASDGATKVSAQNRPSTTASQIRSSTTPYGGRCNARRGNRKSPYDDDVGSSRLSRERGKIEIHATDQAKTTEATGSRDRPGARTWQETQLPRDHSRMRRVGARGHRRAADRGQAAVGRGVRALLFSQSHAEGRIGFRGRATSRPGSFELQEAFESQSSRSGRAAIGRAAAAAPKPRR